jgi:hypothetical protein
VPPARPELESDEEVARVEFLILAVVFIAIGVLIVILRNRRPTVIDAGIADFEARRQALAPSPPSLPAPLPPSSPSQREREPEPRGRRSG